MKTVTMQNNNNGLNNWLSFFKIQNIVSQFIQKRHFSLDSCGAAVALVMVTHKSHSIPRDVRLSLTCATFSHLSDMLSNKGKIP